MGNHKLHSSVDRIRLRERETYRIHDPEGGYFYTGRGGDGKQILMGLLCPNVVSLIFEETGKFLKMEMRPCRTPPHLNSKAGIYDTYDPAFVAGLNEQMAQWREELRFTPGPIVVQSFFICSEGIGIKDRPEFYEEFLTEPESVEEDVEDREIRMREIQEWEDQGDFVFRWGNDYWLDASGDVWSS